MTYDINQFPDHGIVPGFMYVPRFSLKECFLVISKRRITKMSGGYWEYLCLDSGGGLEWHSYMYFDHIISSGEVTTGER